MPVRWEQFSTRWGPLARNLAAGLSGAPAEAEDLVQEAMTALLRAVREDPGRFEDEGHARNYFLRALRNLALKRRERGRAASSLSADPALLELASAQAQGDGRGAGDERDERVARLRLLLRGLASDERALLVRRYLRRETLASISADTGLPVSTLHSREKALIARLSAQVRREEEGAR